VGGPALVVELAGCQGSSANDETATRDENEVLSGPDNTLQFHPETLTIQPDTTVTWSFPTPNHNVSAVPDHDQRVELSDGADPFSSYEGTDTYSTVPVGETFSPHVRDVRQLRVCLNSPRVGRNARDDPPGGLVGRPGSRGRTAQRGVRRRGRVGHQQHRGDQCSSPQERRHV